MNKKIISVSVAGRVNHFYYIYPPSVKVYDKNKRPETETHTRCEMIIYRRGEERITPPPPTTSQP